MIIECAYCEAKVDGKVLFEHIEFLGPDEPDVPLLKVTLLECPSCKTALIGAQYNEDGSTTIDEACWSDIIREWPEPKKYVDWQLPTIVRESLVEADICYKAKAYIACAVMCGRALEGICKAHKTKNKTLAGGLKELLKKNIIDDKIYQWSEMLRKHRNIGAHATTEDITKGDARNLLEFTRAICDYIFVLTRKFEDFMAKKSKKHPKNK